MEELQFMKNLTISQFEEMCDSISPKKYVFDTQNQKYQSDKTLQARFIISFPELIFAHNPDILFFRGGSATQRWCNHRKNGINFQPHP